MSCPASPQCDVTSPEYLEFYNSINESCGSYTTVFPDCSNLSFEDSDSEDEGSDSDSSLFDQDDLAVQVQILETKLLLMQRERDRDKAEMMRLHQALYSVVLDLTTLVATSSHTSTTRHLSSQQSRTNSETQHTVMTASVCVKEGEETKEDEESSWLPSAPVSSATDDCNASCESVCTQESSVRSEQQEFIDRLVKVIDSRNKGPPPPSPYPKVNWAAIKPHLEKQLPKFQEIAISGCPADPNIYPDHPNPQGRVMICSEEILNGGLESTPENQREVELIRDSSDYYRSNFKVFTYNLGKAQLLRKQSYESIEYSGKSPFGSALGFLTNLGVVAPPTHSVNGYIFSKNRWLPRASPGFN